MGGVYRVSSPHGDWLFLGVGRGAGARGNVTEVTASFEAVPGVRA